MDRWCRAAGAATRSARSGCGSPPAAAPTSRGLRVDGGRARRLPGGRGARARRRPARAGRAAGRAHRAARSAPASSSPGSARTRPATGSATSTGGSRPGTATSSSGSTPRSARSTSSWCSTRRSTPASRAGPALDLTVRAATGLAQTYLRSHDRVGLVTFGGPLHWLVPADRPAPALPDQRGADVGAPGPDRPGRRGRRAQHRPPPAAGCCRAARSSRCSPRCWTTARWRRSGTCASAGSRRWSIDVLNAEPDVAPARRRCGAGPAHLADAARGAAGRAGQRRGAGARLGRRRPS